MGLKIIADHFVGAEPAKLHGGRRRQQARVGGEEVASRGQHVAAPALRCTGRAGGQAFPVECHDERGALGLGASLPQRVMALSGVRAPIDVEAVLDGEILEVAEPGVDLAQGLVWVKVGGDAGLAGKVRAPRSLDDELRKTFAPPPVEPIGDGIFVDQPLELLRRAGKLGIDQRRRQMTDGDGGDAPLGLRSLSGVADDERVDHGQRPDDRLGKARAGQRHGLSRKPFERAVRPHMQQRIGLHHVTQPHPEGEQRVARRQRRVMVGRAPVACAPAVGGQRHEQIAEAGRTEAEGAVAEVGIVSRIAPGRVDAAPDLGRKVRNEPPIVLKRQPNGGRARLEPVEQRTGILRRVADAISRLIKVGEHGNDACRHVEADGITGTAGRAGIIRQHHSDKPLRARFRPEAHDGCHAVGDKSDAVGLGTAGKGGEGERGFCRQRVLEGERAGKHAAVKLGQHDMHGKIRRPEPARAFAPGCPPRGGDHRLQHRRINSVERGSLSLAACRERRRGDDDGRRETLQCPVNKFARLRVFQARDHERRWRKTAGAKRLAQRIDRGGVGGEQRRPVEDDRHHRYAGGEFGLKLIERHRALPREITAHAGHWLRLARRQRKAGMASEAAEQSA